MGYPNKIKDMKDIVRGIDKIIKNIHLLNELNGDFKDKREYNSEGCNHENTILNTRKR